MDVKKREKKKRKKNKDATSVQQQYQNISTQQNKPPARYHRTWYVQRIIVRAVDGSTAAYKPTENNESPTLSLYRMAVFI